MKRDTITPCMGCGEGVMHDNNIVFYELRIGYRVADVPAIQRAHGLELMTGSPALANLLGPDEDLAKNVGDDRRGLVCLQCALQKSVAALFEAAAETEPDA